MNLPREVPTAWPSGFVTFVLTDIEGSTRPVEAPRHALRRADRPAQHGAPAVVDGPRRSTGQRARRLVPGRVRVTRRRRSRPAPTPSAAWPPATWPPDGQPRVRMGVHAGLASPRDGDYVALAVHQAARVSAAAHGGQVLTSEVVAAEAGKATDIELAPIGRYRLRDFDEPVPAALPPRRRTGDAVSGGARRAGRWPQPHRAANPALRSRRRGRPRRQTSAARPTRHAHRAGRRRQDPGGPGDRFGGSNGLGRRDLVRRPRAVARRASWSARRSPVPSASRSAGSTAGRRASIISGPSAPSSSSTTASTSPRTSPGWPATC